MPPGQEASDAQQVIVHLTVLEFDQATARKAISSQAPADSVEGQIRKALDGSLFRVLDLDRSGLSKQLDSLQRDSKASVLSQPTIVTVSGRQATFHSGGEIPLPKSPGDKSPVSFLAFGTHFDVTPRLTDDKRVRLDLKAKIVELDRSLDVKVGDQVQPGFRTRQIEAVVELNLSQTLVMGGSTQQQSSRQPSDVTRANRVQNEKTTLWFVSAEVEAVGNTAQAKAATKAGRYGRAQR
jgi:Flp pilus assembly secretin CpaC